MQPITTALCSFGMSGLVFHAPFIAANLKFSLYGVLERTKNLAQEKYPLVKTFRSLEDLLSDDAIELVVVNTPNITHYEFAKKTILAGKNLIVEKPFTATVAEAEELIALAKQKKVTIAVYHNRRYDSDFLSLKEVLDSGVLGTIVEAEFHYDRYKPELSEKVHKEVPTGAVGSLYDLGSHLIDQALQLFGTPDAVFADIAAFRPKSQVGDYFDLKLFYPAHRVILKSSYFVREPLPENILHGRKGSFIKTKADVQEQDLQAGKIPNSMHWGIEPEADKGILHTEKNGVVVKEKITSLKGDYMLYYDAIYDAIRTDKPVPVSAEEGMEVIRVIEAALQSNLEKRVVPLRFD
ncbi:Gfo/Idh/MocA family oxidoreductase [Cellulophaga baltica]|uniref:Gfo/Idh/MocA family oxidoreductase n=1 Tax=Cellulophaga baltica TaxID=76594 RepID=UPI0021476A63|nr:Gfo/Idh/MocA family oxidoreductase [Cellulophaga baltica]MCR1024600.1 Gfo/Idh/MocA family oxidoreductase [Cellulophaga baltica]